MNILICVKQVPCSSDVRVDEQTGVLLRDGIKGKLNPYDLFALEAGFSIAEQYGAKVTALSMGPIQAKEALEETIHMGADKAVLCSDRKFAGADVLATSHALAQGAKAIGEFDIILCGKQTTDGDTAQVGPEMAEHLGIPHVCNVIEIEKIEDGRVLVKVGFEHEILRQWIKLPCLITVEKDINTPRLPSFRRKLAQKDDSVDLLTIADLKEQDAQKYGLSGSPTQVERIFAPSERAQREIYEGSGAELGEKLYNLLSNEKVLED